MVVPSAETTVMVSPTTAVAPAKLKEAAIPLIAYWLAADTALALVALVREALVTVPVAAREIWLLVKVVTLAVAP